jgi:hypothetical protein
MNIVNSLYSGGRSADVNCGEPVFPDRWIGWRAILPSGSAENEGNLRGILALAMPEGLEEDAYGIEALEHRDRVCRFELNRVVFTHTGKRLALALVSSVDRCQFAV